MYGLRPRWIWRVRHIPGPWPYWLTGNMLSILAMGSHLYHAQLKKKYGPIFKVSAALWYPSGLQREWRC